MNSKQEHFVNFLKHNQQIALLMYEFRIENNGDLFEEKIKSFIEGYQEAILALESAFTAENRLSQVN